MTDALRPETCEHDRLLMAWCDECWLWADDVMQGKEQQ